MNIRAAFLTLVSFLIWALAANAGAQVPEIEAPEFTASQLQTRQDTLATNTDLSEDQKAQGKTLYDTALDRLAEATRQKDRRAQYIAEVAGMERTLEDLRATISTARGTLTKKPEPMGQMIGEGALLALEQDLIRQESALRARESELESLGAALGQITTRQTAAPRELAEARTKLSEITASLSETGEAELTPIGDARKAALQARSYYRRMQIAALEQEIASLPIRQNILTNRRTLADLKVQILRRTVQQLQDRTGAKRLNEATQIRDRAAQELETLANAHPLVTGAARVNLDMAEQIRTLASEETNISRLTASIREQQVYVENDLTAASDLVALGRLDRQAGATLRRLGEQLAPPRVIEANMKKTRDDLASVTRQRVIAQEELRDLPVGQVETEQLLKMAREQTPGALRDLSVEDEALLQDQFDQLRELLRKVSTLATSRVNDYSQLQNAQSELLEKTQALQNVLDENLLWVPSVPAIDLSWPKKVALGAYELFSPTHLALSAETLWQQARSYWPLVSLWLAGIILLYRARKDIWAEVLRRANFVGRVKQDSAWHTPYVAVLGVLIALPLPMLFFGLAFLYGSSARPESLIVGLENAFTYLAMFSAVFLTWMVWDKDKSLFAAHFKLPASIRGAIGRNLRWFVPAVGLSSSMLALTADTSGENIYEGFSLFCFILTAIALAVFSFRILWQKRDAYAQLLGGGHPLIKYRGLISVLIIGLPLATAGLAAAGYYASADAVLWRLFVTGWFFLLTYVIYGAIKRAIVVAQRQIKYRQAVERREAELKARREKAEAEMRGDELPPPPPLDTSEIDVSSMTRQSSQLLTTLTVLGLAFLLWINWSGLLPALSIFDGFEVWKYDTGLTNESGDMITQAVSLWDILQSLVIFILTIVAARNLPGFLEIFVLNRVGVDAGTRYAVRTITGYVIVGGGVLFALNELGLQWSQLRWVVTGLSVGIGFGLQKIIANFVSGLIILFERPVRIGDYVTIGEQSGIVSRIQIRATTLNDLDNREILIPNEALVSERVTNWTLSNSVTRLTVPVGIAYGSDTDAAREIMLETLKANPKVLESPSPQVLFFGFGDSSLDFELRVFLRHFDERVPMRHSIHNDIYKALAKAGIPIPFPQTDLNIVSQNMPLEIATKSAKPRKTPKKS